MQYALFQTVKFVLRTVVLVGVPAVLSALVASNPNWGLVVGLMLSVVDKYIHHLPNEYRGLLPF